MEKCKNCEIIHNGSIIKVSEDGRCLFCGRKVGSSMPNNTKKEECHCQRTDRLHRVDSNFKNHTFERCWKDTPSPQSPLSEEGVIKNGYIGEYEGEQLYCNEKDVVRGSFLFKCGKGCKHDTSSNEEAVEENLDTMVRDFCSVIPKSKSEVRRRIELYALNKGTGSFQEGYIEGQKKAFGVDKERVRLEAQRELVDEILKQYKDMNYMDMVNFFKSRGLLPMDSHKKQILLLEASKR